MAETVQGLIDSVKNEGSFDVTDAQALAWLNRRHERMIIRARAYRKTTTLTTVASQRDYTLPADMVEVLEVAVDGTPYGRAHHTDLLYGSQGWVQLSGIGGVVASEESTTGGPEIALYPTPTQGGLSVTVRGTFRPADLSTSDNSTLVVPSEYIDALISGAIATGLKRVENRPDLAQAHEQDYEAACEEFRRQIARRYRGSGPTPIRIQGVNA
jgi:hypothetical protein